MLVREVMSTPAVTVAGTARVKAAIALLDLHDISAMPVIGPSGHLTGVLSEADVIRGMVAADPPGSEILVRLTAAPIHAVVADLMSAPPITVSGDADLAVAADLMVRSAVKTLPVVDDHDGGSLVGVVSRHDIIRVLARPDTWLKSEVEELFWQAGLDWRVDLMDGVALVDGPGAGSDQDLAEVLVNSVPGVIGVRFRSPSR